jgi:hypothetical protein
VEEVTAPAAAAVPSAAEPKRSLVQHVVGLLFSPREEFPSILARPQFWMPLVGWMALGIAFTAFWMQKVEPREFMRNQIQQSGRADKMDPAQLEQVLDTQTGMFKPIAWVSTLVAPPILTLVVAVVYLFVFRFFYEGELTLAQSMAIVAWSFFLMALVTTPLVLLVMALKDEWNVNPQEAMQAGAAMFLDRQTASKPLYALASCLDLFSLWVLWLLSTGYAVATRRATGSAAAGVVGVWVVYVLGKVALAAIF